jgi:hypothetical protein
MKHAEKYILVFETAVDTSASAVELFCKYFLNKQKLKKLFLLYRYHQNLQILL